MRPMDTSLKVCTHYYESPLGSITIASDGLSLTGLWFDGQKSFSDTLATIHETVALCLPSQPAAYESAYLHRRKCYF